MSAAATLGAIYAVGFVFVTLAVLVRIAATEIHHHHTGDHDQ
ncbi:MAG: hypothetical protein AAFY19_00765 [Pseudomonadota bacterium]